MHVFFALTARDQELRQMFGLLFWALLMLIIVIKCWHLSRRPDVSSPCVMSFTIVLVGCVISSVLMANGIWTPQADLVSTALASGTMLVLCVWAIILAIRGLVSYDEKIHRRGRAQAGWAIGLGLFFGLISGFVAMTTYETALQQGVEWLPGEARGTRAGAYWENCSIECPPQWKNEMYPEKIGTRACIALRRSKPEAYAMVIAEPLEDEIDLGACMQALKNNIDGAARAIVEDKTTNLVIDGLPFLQRTCTAKMGEGPTELVYSELWVTTLPGYSWRILCWGPVSHRELLEPQFKRIGESFQMTDKQLRGPRPSN